MNTIDAPSAREALRGIWRAARYPILGNEDWAVGKGLDREALARAAATVPTPDDPPEFTRWITALCDPNLPDSERETIMEAIYDLFEPEYRP